MDWLIGDSRQVPPSAEQLYTERIIRLPHGYVCYGPPDYAPAVTQLPALENGHVTFGCFNRLAKLSDETLALWARVLDAVPQSRLLLNTKELACQGLRERVIGRFSALGITPDQLDLRPGGSHVEMLAAYGEVDVALDPMPYSGGLTTSGVALDGGAGRHIAWTAVLRQTQLEPHHGIGSPGMGGGKRR